MPELIRLYIRSVLIGFALSAAFAAVLIWQDVMGVGHLILGSPVGWIAALMMFVFNGIIFASVQFGLRVMLMAEDDEGPKGGLRQHLPLVPVRAEAPAHRKPR
jgi:TRAP-type C4-dicarboxylate transport system permease small subunit